MDKKTFNLTFKGNAIMMIKEFKIYIYVLRLKIDHITHSFN